VVSRTRVAAVIVRDGRVLMVRARRRGAAAIPIVLPATPRAVDGRPVGR
jgi:hypothetical protein